MLKNFWNVHKSRTIWLGYLVAILPYFDLLNAILKENFKLASTILGVIIIILRFLTKEKLSWKKPTM
jgi:putative flippase GtrA